MKILSIIVILHFGAHWDRVAHAHQPDSTVTGGQASFNFFENSYALSRKDSVLVIFDRYDLCGAGIIKKVYYPGKTQSILVTGIPAGKYIVTMQCLGKHRDRFEKIMRIKSGRTAYVSVKLRPSEEFSKDAVRIPEDRVDFSRLRVVNMK